MEVASRFVIATYYPVTAAEACNCGERLRAASWESQDGLLPCRQGEPREGREEEEEEEKEEEGEDKEEAGASVQL